MKICMVLYDPQAFGGLEEYATSLAIGLQAQGQEVSVLSTTWVPADNQYYRRLREHGVTLVQVPRWLSRPASHWPTKQRILAALMWLAMPLVLLLAAGLTLQRRIPWRQARISAHGWLRGQLQERLVAPDRRRPLALAMLNWWRRRWRPDLLHIQGYTATLLFVIDWAADHDLPVVYEEHQTPDPRFNWWQGFEQSINKATTVIAVSDTSAQGLRSVCGVTRPIVVRNPLLPDPAATTGWTGSANGRGRTSDAPLRVTTVARLDVAKGLTYLLDAIPLVRARHPGTHFEVYGSGALRAELLANADRLGLDGDAIFRGAFTDRAALSQIMAQTDIFAMSSILEGQPLAVVEAMSHGRAIVATTVGGIPELVRHGENGLLCAPRDPHALAAQICRLIEDAALRERLGRAARATYEKGPYQPEAVATHFISIYQQALCQGKARVAGLRPVAVLDQQESLPLS